MEFENAMANLRDRKFGNALITFAASKCNFRSSIGEYSRIITFPSWPAFLPTPETNLNAINRFIQTSYAFCSLMIILLRKSKNPLDDFLIFSYNPPNLTRNLTTGIR